MRQCLIFTLTFWALAAYGQPWNDSVRFLPQNAQLPPDAVKIGTIKVGNNATAVNCDYDHTVDAAKQKAHKMGGNIVRVTKFIAPSFVSKCYKISADVYRSSSLPALLTAPGDSKKVADPRPYSLICAYRLADTIAFDSPYKLHIAGDSTTYYIRNKSRDSVRIYKEGPLTLWAETEKKRELKLDVKTGKTYYVRCGLEMGELRRVPVLELIDSTSGAREFGLGNNRKETDLNYLKQAH